MTAQITSALTQGFTAKQILDFLMKQFPGHSKKIKEALSLGYSAENVLKYLSGGRKELANAEMGTSQARTRQRDIQGREDVTQGALKGAGLAGLGIATALGVPIAGQALQRAAPMATAALQHAAPQLFGPGAATNIGMGQTGQPAATQSPVNQAPIAPSGMNTSQPLVNTPTIPQSQSPMQPEVKTIDTGEILNKHGLSKHVDELAIKRKDPKAIAAILYNKFPKEMQAFQKDVGKNMEDAIADYLAQSGAIMAQKPTTNELPKPTELVEKSEQRVPDLGEMGKGITDNLYQGMFDALKRGSTKFAGIEDPFLKKAKPLFEEGKIKSAEDLKKFANETPKIEKSSVVSSPQGIGEVKEIRNGKALVEVDGKLHKVDEKDLDPPLFTEDEIADAYDDLFRKIPEQHRSGFISWAGYDEDRNVLGFIPRSGKYEELENITPTEAFIIKEGIGTARTSGEKREGLWVVGEDTRGGLISQIIHDRKRARKEQEEKQLKLGFELPKPEKQDRGMKPIFDEMAHARNLSRTRERKKKEEEKARLKKEKDEAKKRKK